MKVRGEHDKDQKSRMFMQKCIQRPVQVKHWDQIMEGLGSDNGGPGFYSKCGMGFGGF